jgi:choline kinase
MSIKHIKQIDRPNKIDILIPAAGEGSRMKSYGPKPLIKIGHTTILNNQLRLLKKNSKIDINNIILVCGFEAEKLMSQSPDNLIKIENQFYNNTNVVRSIGMGLRAAQKPVLIIYGDLIFNNFCLDAINLNKSSMVVGDTMKENEVGCTINKYGYVENMMYDLPTKWCQIAYFTGRELKLLKQYCWEKTFHNMFGFEIINKIIIEGGKFKAETHPKVKAIDIDTYKDLERVKNVI